MAKSAVSTRRRKNTDLAVYVPELAGKNRAAVKPSPTESDRVRWVMFKAHGKPIEEIAALTGSTAIAVQKSINEMENYQSYFSVSALETKTIETVMNQMDGVGKVFNEGLKANKSISLGGGKTKSVTDWGTRLKTAETIKSLMETVRPKGPGIQFNQQINTAEPGATFASGMSFEAMLRKKREQYGLANEQEVETVEAEISHEDSVADEFADFGGGDDDDDGEEDS